MLITEKDLGFTLIDASNNVDTTHWLIIDFKIYKSIKENCDLSVAFNINANKEYSLLDDIKLDYIEFIKPYLVKVNESNDNLGIHYSDSIDIIYDIPEESMFYWTLKYQQILK